MAEDLNGKHVDWNSRLTTTRWRLLRGYADRTSCLKFGPDSPTIIPYNPSAIPDVLDIVLTKTFVSPVSLTTCLLGTQLRLPPRADRLYVPFNLPNPSPCPDLK